MEGEKKRKRGENGELKVRDRRKMEGEAVMEREDNIEAVASQPSEEEVEEFFTILRRMHVAVKYFEKTGTSVSDVNGGDGLGNNLKVLDKKAATVVDSEKKKSLGIGNGGGLDLNAIPEAES